MVVPVLSRSYEERLTQVATACSGRELEALAEALQEDVSGEGNPSIGAMAVALSRWRLAQYLDARHILLPLEHSLSEDPRYWILRGMVNRQIPGLLPESLHAYRRAIDLDASRADLHYNLANLLSESDFSAAKTAYFRSLDIDPFQAGCWHNLGSLYSRQDAYAQARYCYRVSLLLDPLAANVLCDYGNVLRVTDCLLPSKNAYALAVSLDPLYGPGYVNLGAALVDEHQTERALEILQRGVELEKSSSDSLWNLSLAYLQLGDYNKGWKLYESRLYRDSGLSDRLNLSLIPLSIDACPREGEPPLVVWSEQGIGDSIQFCRYLFLLAALRIPFQFRVRPVLLRLFRDWAGLGQSVVEHSSSSGLDVPQSNISLLSLPRLFNTSVATIPSTLPYLCPPGPPPSHLEVPEPPGGLSVGLVWASDPSNSALYRRKSLPLSLLIPRLLQLLDMDLINLHSLQYGEDQYQITPWADHPRITNWAPYLSDFADTAHVVNQLDLVITVDTAVAHLAAAMRVNTWILLPYAADFRWMQARSDSPWYPGTMRLFRQQSQGAWGPVIESVNASLDELFLLELGALMSNA